VTLQEEKDVKFIKIDRKTAIQNTQLSAQLERRGCSKLS
jgi:hypothetical protein